MVLDGEKKEAMTSNEREAAMSCTTSLTTAPSLNERPTSPNNKVESPNIDVKKQNDANIIAEKNTVIAAGAATNVREQQLTTSEGNNIGETSTTSNTTMTETTSPLTADSLGHEVKESCPTTCKTADIAVTQQAAKDNTATATPDRVEEKEASANIMEPTRTTTGPPSTMSKEKAPQTASAGQPAISDLYCELTECGKKILHTGRSACAWFRQSSAFTQIVQRSVYEIKKNVWFQIKIPVPEDVDRKRQEDLKRQTEEARERGFATRGSGGEDSGEQHGLSKGFGKGAYWSSKGYNNFWKGKKGSSYGSHQKGSMSKGSGYYNNWGQGAVRGYGQSVDRRLWGQTERATPYN